MKIVKERNYLKIILFFTVALSPVNFSFASDNQEQSAKCRALEVSDNLLCTLAYIGIAVGIVSGFVGGLVILNALNPITRYLGEAAVETLPGTTYRNGSLIRDKAKYIEKHGTPDEKSSLRKNFVNKVCKEKNIDPDKLNNLIESQPGESEIIQIKSAASQLQGSMKDTRLSAEELFNLTDQLPETVGDSMTERLTLTRNTIKTMEQDGTFIKRGRFRAGKNATDIDDLEFIEQFKATTRAILSLDTSNESVEPIFSTGAGGIGENTGVDSIFEKISASGDIDLKAQIQSQITKERLTRSDFHEQVEALRTKVETMENEEASLDKTENDQLIEDRAKLEAAKETEADTTTHFEPE